MLGGVCVTGLTSVAGANTGVGGRIVPKTSSPGSFSTFFGSVLAAHAGFELFADAATAPNADGPAEANALKPPPVVDEVDVFAGLGVGVVAEPNADCPKLDCPKADLPRGDDCPKPLCPNGDGLPKLVEPKAEVAGLGANPVVPKPEDAAAGLLASVTGGVDDPELKADVEEPDVKALVPELNAEGLENVEVLPPPNAPKPEAGLIKLDEAPPLFVLAVELKAAVG